MPSQIKNLKKDLRASVIPGKKEVLTSFFKAEPGGYGEGDRFLGIIVPEIKKVSKTYRDLEKSELEDLLQSPWHEERHCALHIITLQFARGSETQKTTLYRILKKHIAFVNNWDLVDLVGSKITGPYFWDRDRQQLYRWSRSKSLWQQRLAIISCFYFIKNKDYDDAIALCEDYLNSEEDLIHKASGWMLREVGKRSPSLLKKFLKNYVREMPRTMLRYAIENMAKDERQKWLRKV